VTGDYDAKDMAEVNLLSEIWGRISSLAYESDSFRLRLMTMPAVVLNENGASIPHSLRVEIVDDGSVSPGSWQMRRHGDKTTLVLSLPDRVVAAAS
jgi:hypothetical protein